MTRMFVAALAMALALPGCICAPGKVTCDRSCVDVETDAKNCGACGEACAASQICVAGECVGSGGPPCTSDARCDDGRYCNGAERCIEGFCRLGRDVICNDGVACTDEVCSEELGVCVTRPAHSRCAVGQQCTGAATQSGCE